MSEESATDSVAVGLRALFEKITPRISTLRRKKMTLFDRAS